MSTRPKELDDVLQFLITKQIEGVTILKGLPTVLDYAEHEPVPEGFPRPQDHHVLLEHNIDLPVVAVDFSDEFGSHGRVIGYCQGNYWICADSLSAFIHSISLYDESAFFGK